MSKDPAKAHAALQAKVLRQKAQELNLRAEILAVEEAIRLLADYRSISGKEVLARLDTRKRYWRNHLLNEQNRYEL